MEMTVDKETPLMGLNVILFLHLFIHPVVLIRVVAGLEAGGERRSTTWTGLKSYAGQT